MEGFIKCRTLPGAVVWVNKRHVKMFYLSETGIEDITGGSIAPTIEAVMMDNSRYTVSDPFSLYKALGEG